MWAGYKDKVPDVSDDHQNIGTSCNSKLKLPNLKICVSKNYKKTTKIWMNVCKQRNCKPLKFQWKNSVQIMTFCFPFENVYFWHWRGIA